MLGHISQRSLAISHAIRHWLRKVHIILPLILITSASGKLVAWFVSHCGAASNRDLYVNELSKWIPVDIYGGCGTLTCSRNPPKPRGAQKPWTYDDDEEDEFQQDMNDCDRMLESDYKFYLAFENSLCKDYTTEKFWQKLTMSIVVVVLKRSIVEPYAPPGSFIAADDFKSPRDLAIYLKALDSDPLAYRRRFDWRINYRQVFLNGGVHDARERPWGFCRICAIVKQKGIQKTYENINDWWTNGGSCDNELVKLILKASKV